MRVRSAASIAKARALLGIDRPADAATAVAGIATTYSYDHTFATTSGDNAIWAQGASQQRYAVGANPEGNSGTFPVGPAVAFFQLRDPRVPAAFGAGLAQDGQTRSRNTTIRGRSTAVAVVNGVDARLIEAEAALRAGNATQMLTILNALRATPPKLGERPEPSGLAPLTDPGTEAARVDVLFREKALWTFGRGQRLGDLRRLIRQYGRTAAQTFPTGSITRVANTVVRSTSRFRRTKTTIRRLQGVRIERLTTNWIIGWSLEIERGCLIGPAT